MNHYIHLAPFENAARIYCGMIEVDPDGLYHDQHPLGLQNVPHTRPLWHRHAEALITLSQMLNALRLGSTQVQ